jgi:hypothetical protein
MVVVAVLAIGMVAGAAAAIGTAMPGVPDPQRARVNWMLKCQGCHRPDGQGSPATAPAMAGQVARFLAVPGGREFLGQVPGVATAALPDDQLAELLNWTLQHFDAGHVPAGFRPYTTDEIRKLREKPLRIEAAATRARLMADLETRERIDATKLKKGDVQ